MLMRSACAFDDMAPYSSTTALGAILMDAAWVRWIALMALRCSSPPRNIHSPRTLSPVYLMSVFPLFALPSYKSGRLLYYSLGPEMRAPSFRHCISSSSQKKETIAAAALCSTNIIYEGRKVYTVCVCKVGPRSAVVYTHGHGVLVPLVQREGGRNETLRLLTVFLNWT